MELTITIVWLLLIATVSVDGYHNGAPIQACNTFTPDHNTEPSTDPIPFTVDLTNFNDSYLPGHTYNITLRKSVAGNFKGFLIQGRTVADDSPAGTFVAMGETYKTQCIDRSGATHQAPTNKTLASLIWIAPAVGTGPIRFRFAFVQRYAVFWNNRMTSQLEEAEITYSIPMITTTIMATPTITPTITTTTPAPTERGGGGGSTGLLASTMLALLLPCIILTIE